MAERRELVTGYAVYRSPEFKAFCERFGIAWDMPTTDMTIHLTEDEMIITHQYRGRDRSQLIEKPTYVDALR